MALVTDYESKLGVAFIQSEQRCEALMTRTDALMANQTNTEQQRILTAQPLLTIIKFTS